MGRRGTHCTLLGLLFLLVAHFEFSQAQCSRATNCSQCMDAGPTCKWCADETDTWRMQTRCRAAFNSTRCNNILDLHSSVQYTESLAFNDDIQVQPQIVTANLRPGQKVVFTAQIKPSRNYPLDVYYLMDHSASMKDDLTTMKLFSASIASGIRNITSGFRLGYGAYVDKPAMPFAYANLDGPLIPAKGTLKPFAFINSLPLTSNGSQFTTVISDDIISGNLDHPEGTLDAMIQAAVCTERIGWRQNSRRVMLVATDHIPHYAGAGQLLGISTPNDGKCHLDEDDIYTDFYYDYPSASYATYILRREKILPIFMVTTRPQLHYNLLVDEMSSIGARRVALTENSDNIIQILSDELSRLVRLGRIVPLPYTGVTIKVETFCPDGNASVTDSTTGFQQCTNLDFGKNATFKITLQAHNCSELKKTKNLVLRVIGYGDIEVKVNALCQCPCEASPTKNSAFCSKQGASECGVCACNHGFKNKVAGVSRCDCNTLNTAQCRQSASSPVVCNGRGDCVCEKCQCRAAVGTKIVGARYTGNYCECDNFNCPVTEAGLLCGGTSQGQCVCGQCQCKPGFIKDDCSCPLSNSTCMYEGSVCNNAGTCVCGECQCDPTNGGDFCETCVSDLTICDRAARCFNCSGDNGNGRCEPECAGVVVGANGTLPALAAGQTVVQCSSPVLLDAGKCMTNTFEAYEDNTKGRPCRRPLAPFVPAACPQAQAVDTKKLTIGLAAGLAGAGVLVLIIIKAVIFYRERREYKQFLKAVDQGGKDISENPLFETANKVFVNPEYSKTHEPQSPGPDQALSSNSASASRTNSIGMSPSISGMRYSLSQNNLIGD